MMMLLPAAIEWACGRVLKIGMEEFRLSRNSSLPLQSTEPSVSRCGGLLHIAKPSRRWCREAAKP